MPPPNQSPNPAIDNAIKRQMEKLSYEGESEVPPDVAVKILNTAIAWEKVKHQIKETEGFDPEAL
jgi:hypothetical protein